MSPTPTSPGLRPSGDYRASERSADARMFQTVPCKRQATSGQISAAWCALPGLGLLGIRYSLRVATEQDGPQNGRMVIPETDLLHINRWCR